MTGTNRSTSVQSTVFLQRAAELATASGLAVLLADRATPAKTMRRSTPSVADTTTAILCSMRPPPSGSDAVGGARWPVGGPVSSQPASFAQLVKRAPPRHPGTCRHELSRAMFVGHVC